MSLLTTSNDDIGTAMKAKDRETSAVLRMLKAAIQNDRVKTGRESNGEEGFTVLSREMERRKDSLSELEKAGRDNPVGKVKVKVAIVEKCMSQQLTEEEVRQLVQEVMTQIGATSPEDFGKMMGAMIPKVKGKADGNQVNTIVKESL